MLGFVRAMLRETPTEASITSGHFDGIVGTCGRVGAPRRRIWRDARAAALIHTHEVKARKDAIVEASPTSATNRMATTRNIIVIHGHARLASPREPDVARRSLTAAWVFVNVGGQPATQG